METVTLLGEKPDGSRDVLGEVPMPPAMKRIDIVRNMFGTPTPDGDGSDADCCLWSLEQYHEWLLEQGWQAPPLEVTPNIPLEQQAAQDTYEKPEHGWTCFHCGETFTTPGTARDHFGAEQSAIPGCMIKVQLGAERGLLIPCAKQKNSLRVTWPRTPICIVPCTGCKAGIPTRFAMRKWPGMRAACVTG